MTDSTSKLPRDFRAEVAEPGEETARRIYALVTAPATGKQRDFSTRQGFAMTMPHADVSKAHGVIEIETPDGPQDLWAAPSDQGGNCYFIDWVDDPSGATGKLGIGGCDPSPAPVSNINWGQVWFRPHPDLVTVWGSVFIDAATVEVVLETGSTLALPIVEGLFLGSLAKGEKVVKVTALDTSGNAVAEWTKPR